MKEFLFQVVIACLLFYILMGIGYTIIKFKDDPEAQRLWGVSKLSFFYFFGLSVIVWLPMEIGE